MHCRIHITRDFLNQEDGITTTTWPGVDSVCGVMGSDGYISDKKSAACVIKLSTRADKRYIYIWLLC